MANNYNEAARSLALPIDDPPSPNEQRPSSPLWRRSTSTSRARSATSHGAPSYWQRMTRRQSKLQRQAYNFLFGLPPLKRALFVLFVMFIVAFIILSLVFGKKFWTWLGPKAEAWREVPAGWLVLWAIVVVSAMPPLIGYSTWLTVCGFVYGFPNGWFIAATATVVGSTISFLICQRLLKGWSERSFGSDKRFAAIALTLKHDGLKLLCMVRLCPLPYSISNGAIATIPTVTWMNFAIATALVSPKLMIHVFVGSRIKDLAMNGEHMDAKAKAVSYLSMIIGGVAGAATGYFFYKQTKKRAKELEAQEAEAARRASGEQLARQYSDDPAALEAADVLRDDDDISLRTEEAPTPRQHPTYTDDFSDDDDPFQHGDGDEEEARAGHGNDR